MNELKHVTKSLPELILNRASTRRHIVFFCSLFFFAVTGAQERNYEVPLSSSTATGIAPISDTDMEKCVETYNEANWLKQELDNTQVDLSQPASVDAYNSKASHYSKLSNYYNHNCAGKKSSNAERVTKKLNQLKSQ